VLASTQPSTLIDTPTPTHTSRRPLSESGLLLSKEGQTNNPLSFLVKGGEGIDIR
jgi:hypothetical protein